MKASELRIGNLCRDKVSGTFLRVTKLDDRNNIDFFVIDRSMYPLKEGWVAEYIPLTEEWFLKLGCVSNGTIFSLPEIMEDKCKGDIGLHYVSMFFNERLYRWMDCQTRVCIDYVHQFQNLVSINMGEEIGIKL